MDISVGKYPGQRLFSLMLVFEGHSRLVADFGGTEVLNGTGIYIRCVDRPVVTLGCVFEEGCAIEMNESLLDNGFHLAVATFHVHHHGDRYTAGNPLY